MQREIFARNLRRLRLEKGYTQEQLAEMMNVSPKSVSRWECGNTLPDVMQLPELARVYGVTVEDLYREEVSVYPNFAQRLLAVYEASGRTEDFLAAEREFAQLMEGEHTADDLRAFGVLYHYMMSRCAAAAEEYLKAAMEKAERSDRVYLSAAQQKTALLCAMGRGGEDIARYERELREDTSDPRRWLLSVAAHHLSGENERALELAEEAVSKFPENALLCIYAGDICRALKRFDEAFDYWKRARELDKAALDPYYSMGFCYEELGRYAEACEVWNDLRRELMSRGLTQECKLPTEHAKFCEARK